MIVAAAAATSKPSIRSIFHLPSGEVLPRLGVKETYKHMGILRRMYRDGAPAATAVCSRGKVATARLSQFALLSVRARVRACDIVLGATVAYYGSSCVVSWAECKAIK